MATGLDEHYDSPEVRSWQEALESLRAAITEERSKKTDLRTSLTPALNEIAGLLRDTSNPKLLTAATRIAAFTATHEEISKGWRSLVHDLKNIFLSLTTGRYPLFWTRSLHGCIITT